ncbi:hypothetical protein J6590_105135 [Homalodisca vitripennis]|nr:hypothetical protein J6590_102581 [Homalodisca vitripennis]KAG8303977.1 hypothetical protein J6590_105135 [Homalodisca vitripennis]
MAAGTQLIRGANSWAARIARLRRPYGPARDYLGPCRLPDGKHFASPGPRNGAIGCRRLVSRLESRSLSELTRQIAPQTKNGHGPPHT